MPSNRPDREAAPSLHPRPPWQGPKRTSRTPELVFVTLAYRPPYDWETMRAYLAARAVPGVEAVTSEGRYCRSVRIDGHQGHITVGPPGDARGARVTHRVDMLRLDLSVSLLPRLIPLMARLRRLFDLDADPEIVAAHLGRHPALAPLVARRPGLRAPGTVDGFELALRAVLGQQVTVRGASTLAGRLVRLVAEPLPGTTPSTNQSSAPVTHLPVTAERLADASAATLAGMGLPRARIACIVALAGSVARGELPELTSNTPVGDPTTFARRLRELPGIGAWTAEYIVMRALHWPDAFPDGDLGLRKAMGGLSPARLCAAAEAWRPWRAYAAQHLWASLGDSPA
jgi:AraC family transcriptional regulator of adaptative response / DNA-3-methyladenine glycosylase II